MPGDPSPPAGTHSGPRRWLASGALLVGGVLAAAGPFLPWVRVHYPAVADEPASTFYDMPGRDLGVVLLGEVTAPNRFSLSLTLLSLLFFGAPPCFAALGACALLRRDWLPSQRVRRLCVALALVGGIVNILTAYVLVNFVGSLDVIVATRTPLLGYLCALIGVILLPAGPSSSRR